MSVIGHPGRQILKVLEKSYAGVLLALVLCAIAVIFNRFHMTTDLGAFLPKGESAVETLMVDLLDKGASSNLMFIGISDAEPERLVQANHDLKNILEQSEYIVSVQNSPAQLSEQQQQLIRDYRYLLSKKSAATNMSEQGLREALNERMKGLTSPLSSLEKKFIRFDPTGEILNIMQQVSGQDNDQNAAPKLVDGTWISRSGKRSLMVVEVDATAFDLDGLSAAYNTIFDSLTKIAQKNQVSFTITGPGAFAVFTQDVIRDDVRLLSIMATVGVGLFLFLALRSFSMLLMVFVPLFCGIVCAIASVVLVFGKINGITLAFGVTLIGVAIDYPIHFFTHLKNNKRDPSKSSLKLIWPTLRLGVLSTIIAYGSLLFSELSGLKQLGLFTITGLLVAALTTRWVLPLIVSDTTPMKSGLPRLHQFLERLALPAYKVRWLMLAATMFSLLFLIFQDSNIADYNTRSLSPITKTQSAIDRQVRSELGHWSGGNLLLVTGDTDQQVLMRLEQMAPFLNSLINKEIISDYTSVASLLPSVQLQLQRQSKLPEKDELEKNLLLIQDEFPFKPGLFTSFIEDVQASKSLQPITFEGLDDYQLQDKVAALLHQKDQLWYAPVLLYRVLDNEVLKNQLDKQYPQQDWVNYINLQAQANQIMENALTNMIKLITIGGFCIYLLLALNFRDFIRPMKILLPTLMAVGLTVFILVVCGISLNVFHIVSLLLVVGLGLDYSLFFHRLTDHAEEWSSTFRALWICCFSTVLVFGLLIFSKTPPLHAVGITVAIGAFLCLILGAMFAARSLRHPEET